MPPARKRDIVKMKSRLGVTLRAITVAACARGRRCDTRGTNSLPAAPDNSKVNERDRAKGATTADQRATPSQM